jgi:CelD/BcsL family acetyltransferase involved in cellulose biosynthesis
MLYAGDRPVAGHLGLRSSTSCSYWFPAYDVEFQPYSPGGYLLLRLAETHAQMGVRYLDLGPGEELYKRRFASTQVWLAEGSVDRRGPVALARAASRVPRRLGERYLTGTAAEPVVKGALGALKRLRRKVG